MAKLSLTIQGKTAEITVENSVAIEIRERAWDAYHRNGETATAQEKLDWLVDTILRDALTAASARKDRVEEREARRAEHEARRARRESMRESRGKAPKFK